MKNKIISLLLSVMLIVSLSACGNTSNTTQSNITNPPITDNVPIETEEKQPEIENNPIETEDEQTKVENEQTKSENEQTKSENEQTETSDITYEIEVIDCGQADSILITGNGTSILIDAGEDRDAHDIKEALNQHNIETIDLLVATHPHADHIGGMQEIVENYDIEEILMYPTGHNTKLYTNLLNSIDNKGYSITAAEVGDIYKYDSLEFKVLSPIKEYNDPNNCSVVLELNYNNFSMLLTGDAETQAENDYINNVKDIDILKSGHHGSITSSSEELLNKALPEIALISCGIDNKYGHPDPETLEKYNKHNIKTYRTDESGNLYVVTDGNGYNIYTEKDGYTISSNETTKNENYNQEITNNSNTDINSNTTENVFITKSGSKYHSSTTCSSLSKSTNIEEVSEDTAKSLGLERCSKCWK